MVRGRCPVRSRRYDMVVDFEAVAAGRGASGREGRPPPTPGRREGPSAHSGAPCGSAPARRRRRTARSKGMERLGRYGEVLKEIRRVQVARIPRHAYRTGGGIRGRGRHRLRGSYIILE